MLGLLGDEWTLLILQQALLGLTRYAEWRSALPVSEAVLTARLRLLVGEGLLERKEYQQTPVRHSYALTDRGASLWPVLLSVWEWERTWVVQHGADLPSMRHATCRREFAPVSTCRVCGSALVAREVGVAWGPSGTWERSVPDASTRRRTSSRDAGLFPDTTTIVGNRWSSAVVAAAFRGVTRFGDFQGVLGASPSIVTDRLRALVAIDVLDVVGSDYHLTDKGRAFLPVLLAAFAWAERWYVAAEGPALTMTHHSCGAELELVLRCSHCRERLTGAAVRVLPRA